MREKAVERLWKVTEELNILYKENWTNLANEELINFQRQLLLLTKTGLENNGMNKKNKNKIRKTFPSQGLGTLIDSEHQDQTEEWTLAGSFLYSLALITTVGMKHSSELLKVYFRFVKFYRY
jgi:hypothetical protein